MAAMGEVASTCRFWREAAESCRWCRVGSCFDAVFSYSDALSRVHFPEKMGGRGGARRFDQPCVEEEEGNGVEFTFETCKSVL